MKELTPAKKLLFLFVFSVVLTTTTALLINAKVSTNNYPNSFAANVLFVNITFMGDAFFAFGLIGLMLFFFNRKDLALHLLLTVIVSLVITQLSKMIFSSRQAQLYFEAGNPGSNPDNIFLSSHTAVAFTLAIFFALQMKNNLAIAGLFVAATAVAYTRIWLGESMIAMVCGLFPAVTAVFFTKWLSSADRHVSIFKKRKISRTNKQQLFPG